MKQVTPNLFDVARVRYIAQLSYERRFLRYWGTELIDGEEVFKHRRYYYKTMDEDMKKLALMLGMFDDFSAKQRGVDSAWLYLNPAKADDSLVDIDLAALAVNLTAAMETISRGSVVISAKSKGGKFITPPIVTPVSDQAGLKAEIVADYEDYWADGYPIFTDKSEGFAAIVLSYLLKSSTVPYTIVAVEETTVSKTNLSGANEEFIRTSTGPAWRLRLEFDPISLSASTDIVQRIADDIAERGNTTAKIIGSIFDTVEEEPQATEDIATTTTSSNWIAKTESRTNREGDTYQKVVGHYLKTSVWKTSSLSRENKIKYVNSCIDTGFKKESAPWYVTLIMIAIVVVAAYVAGPAGATAAASFTGAAATVVSIAVTISVAAMYVSLAAMAAGMMGAPHVAASLGTTLKNMAPLIRVAQVIALVAGIYKLVEQGSKRATENAIQAGGSATDATIGDVAIEVGKEVLESVTGIPLNSDIEVQHVTKMLNTSFGLYQDYQMADLQKTTKNYRTEMAELKEAKKQNQTSDIVKDLMAAYPDPLSIDQSVYAGIYDKPFESWATPYHTGNIQATTVSALWLSDQ
jgi:uncharacterized membrane protein YhaH (DUF805 family)